MSLRLNKYPGERGVTETISKEKIKETKSYNFCEERLETRKWVLINEMSRVEDIGSFNNYLVHNFRKLQMETGSAF